MLHKKMAASLFSLVLLFSVTACAGGGTTDSAPTDSKSVGLGADAEAMLAGYDIAAPSSVEKLIEQLQAQPLAERPDGLLASVRVNELLLSSGGKEVSLPIAEGKFHLSIAPYLESTHECFYHSLTTCKGELTGQQLQVTITDDSTSEVLLDSEVTTFENGFFDVWLPAERNITVMISDGEHTAEVPLGTSEEDPTCVTTVQLT